RTARSMDRPCARDAARCAGDGVRASPSPSRRAHAAAVGSSVGLRTPADEDAVALALGEAVATCRGESAAAWGEADASGARSRARVQAAADRAAATRPEVVRRP